MFCRLSLLLPFLWVSAFAQQNRSFSDHIRTVETVVNGDRQLPSMIKLDGSDVVKVSFDDMTHDYVRYVYKLEHCNRDWQVSDGLFESDYMTGTNFDRPIDDYTRSSNTSNLYTHYELAFPNKYVKPLLSGNYKVGIYDSEDTDNPVAVAFFSVVDNKLGVMATASSNTDIDRNESHQQLELCVSLSNVDFRDPSREIFVKVLQNKRYDNMVSCPEPTYISDREVKWQHCRDLIFPGGNEFRKFEILNVHQPTLGVDKIRWFQPFYHAFLYPGKKFGNYINNQEINGSYVVRNEDNVDNDVKSEYVIVHFALESDAVLEGGDFYVCGQWNSYNYLPEYKMKYNFEENVYEAAVLLKQGYYNYAYMFVPDKSKTGSMSESEGDFFQTENEYTVLVYARLQGERYDRLLGCRDFRYIPNK